MSWMQRLFGRPQAAENVTDFTIEDLARAMGGGGDGSIVSGTTVVGIPTVFRCVNVIADAIAQFPLEIVRRVDDSTREPVHDHPVAIALRQQPNEIHSPFQFRKLMMARVLLVGNAYALIGRSLRPAGPVNLMPLESRRMKPEITRDGRLVYNYTESDGSRTQYPADRIFHLRGLSHDGIEGLSPITVARRAFEVALQAQDARSRFYKQGNFAGYAVKFPAKLAPEARKVIREWLKETGGVANTGEPMILDQGMELETLGMNSADAEFVAAGHFNIRDLARLFGVMPHIIGDTEPSTSFGAGIEHQNIGFDNYTLQGHIGEFQSAVAFQLLHRGAGRDFNLQCRISSAAFLKGDRKTQLAWLVGLVKGGIMSPNEARAKLDMPPREGGDEFADAVAGGASDAEIERMLTDRDSENEPSPAS